MDLSMLYDSALPCSATFPHPQSVLCDSALPCSASSHTLNQCFVIQHFPAQSLPTPSISTLRFSASLLSLFPHPQLVRGGSALPCSDSSHTLSQYFAVQRFATCSSSTLQFNISTYRYTQHSAVESFAILMY